MTDDRTPGREEPTNRRRLLAPAARIRTSSVAGYRDDEGAGGQRNPRGSYVRGETDGTPCEPCSGDLPDGDGVGHTGGRR